MPKKSAISMQHLPRKKLTDVSAREMQSLEDWLGEANPFVLSEVARSCYLTLLSLPDWRLLDEAELAAQLMNGVAHDMGGAQFYIPSLRTRADVSARTKKVLELLDGDVGYREVASRVGLCESQVRKIERSERSKGRRIGSRISDTEQ